MKSMLISILSLLGVVAHAEERRVHQLDSEGRTVHHKPSYSVQKDGRIVEVDPAGTKHYHKQQFRLKDGKFYHADPAGRIQHHKPNYTIQKDGRIIESDALGQEQHHKQQYQLKDDKIYPVDSYGNILHHKPGFVVK